MQSQVIICDQQAIYAMGSALMVEKHASYLPATIINSLTHISDLLVANVPGVLVIDSSLVDFSDHSKKEHITAIKKRTPIMIVLNEDDNLLLFQFIGYSCAQPSARHLHIACFYVRFVKDITSIYIG